MKAFLGFWSLLDGRKTVLSAIMYPVADIAEVLGQKETAEIVRQLAYLMTSLGLGHKGVKKFS